MLELKLVLHDARTDPPKRSMNHGECIAIMPGGYIDTIPYSARHKAFNAYDGIDEAKCQLYPIYWAEVPAELRGIYKDGTEV